MRGTPDVQRHLSGGSVPNGLRGRLTRDGEPLLDVVKREPPVVQSRRACSSARALFAARRKKRTMIVQVETTDDLHDRTGGLLVVDRQMPHSASSVS